jgi:DNA-binding NarL/FixJ family response regulator
MLTVQRSSFRPQSDNSNSGLSRLQKEILVRFAPGAIDIDAENARIAKELAIDERTVQVCSAFILQHLGVTTRDKVLKVAVKCKIIHRFTAKELLVLPRLIMRNKAIIEDLFENDSSMSLRTVDHYISNIIAKINAETRTEAIMRAIQVGVLSVAPLSGNERPNEKLTDRELEVVTCLYLPNETISEHFDMKLRTVEKHVEEILAKLKSITRQEAFIKAIQLGSVELPMPTGKLYELDIPIAA